MAGKQEGIGLLVVCRPLVHNLIFRFPQALVVRNLSPMSGWQLEIHQLLLNLDSGVGDELLLAFDASLTYCFKLSRVPDFVE